MNFMPKSSESISGNVADQESDNNQTNSAHQVKRHNRKRIVERMQIVNKIKQRLCEVKSYQNSPSQMKQAHKGTQN